MIIIKRPKGLGKPATYGSASLVALFLVLPLLVIIPVSFSSAQYLSFPPPGYSLQWYESFFNDPGWLDSLTLSSVLSLIATAIVVPLGVLASIALIRGRFRGKSALYALVLSPLITPTVITGMGLYFFFARLGAVGNPIAMSLGMSVLAFPLVVTIITATLRDFDERLEQAARSLGAHPVVAFVRVTLPIIAPGVVVASLFTFLFTFDELTIPLLLLGPETITLPVKIWQSIARDIDPTVAAVGCILLVIALAIMITANLVERRKTARSLATQAGRASREMERLA